MKKIISIFLIIIIILFSMSSCKSSEVTSATVSNITESKTSIIDGYDKKKDSLVMDIGAWYSPKLTDKDFKDYVDSGIDMMFLQGNNVGDVTSFESNVKGLKLCEKYGIKAYLWANSKAYGVGHELLYDYSKYSAFKGIIYDEPTKNQVDSITNIASRVKPFEQKYPNGTIYVNLFPLRGTTASGYDSYTAYLDDDYNKILSKLKGEKWLSVDDYPLLVRSTINNGTTVKEKYINDMWLKNVEYVAQYAKKYEDLKTHFFIQTMAYSSTNDRTPTEADLRLQVYGLLAFGIDSFSHFCYWTPDVGPEFSEKQYAMIDRNGKKTELYNSALNVNHEILSFDHV